MEMDMQVDDHDQVENEIEDLELKSQLMSDNLNQSLHRSSKAQHKQSMLQQGGHILQ